MRAICPECEALVHIKETGIPIGAPGKQGTATYKEIHTHPDERTSKTTESGMVIEQECRGSGRRV